MHAEKHTGQNMAQASRSAKAHALYELIMERYTVFRHFKPLAIGMREAVLADMPDVDQQALRDVFMRHCDRPRYVESIARGGNRFNLQGEPVGEVSEHDIEVAKNWISQNHEHGRAREAARQHRIQQNDAFHARRRSRKLGATSRQDGRKRRDVANPLPQSSGNSERPIGNGKPKSEPKPVLVTMKKRRVIDPDQK